MGNRRSSPLGKLARSLWRAASLVNTANIILSGNPNRIAKHYVRKTLYKRGSTMLRKTIK